MLVFCFVMGTSAFLFTSMVYGIHTSSQKKTIDWLTQGSASIKDAKKKEPEPTKKIPVKKLKKQKNKPRSAQTK